MKRFKWFRRKPKPPDEPLTSRLVLHQTVRVADVLRYPNGGPLVVLPRGTFIEDIEQQYVDQLCDKHFIRIPSRPVSPPSTTSA